MPASLGERCGPHAHRRRVGGGDAGFTIVEVLVSLTLLALLLTMLPTALRLAGHAWGTADRLQQGSARAVVETYLAARISEAMPLTQRDDLGAARIAFRGAPRALSFVASVRDGPSGAGLFAYDLSVRGAESGHGGQALWLAWRPFRPQSERAPTSEAVDGPASERVLISDLGTFGLRYFGSRDGQRLWSDAWTRPDALPEMVELRVASRAEGAASVLIALRLRAHP